MEKLYRCRGSTLPTEREFFARVNASVPRADLSSVFVRNKCRGTLREAAANKAENVSRGLREDDNGSAKNTRDCEFQ